YKQPIGMITKNALVLRDLDILKEMAQEKLCMVYISINSLNEDLRLKMEPRTATAVQRLKVVEQLSAAGIPVGVMVAPLIPGLSDHEVTATLKAVAEDKRYNLGRLMMREGG